MVGVREGYTLSFNVGSVSIALGKIDSYFDLVASFEPVCLDVNYDSVVASLVDPSDEPVGLGGSAVAHD
jgi:hypothetical protein